MYISIFIYTHILTTLRCNWLWLEILSIWQILQLGGETTLRPLWAFLPAGQGPFRQITIADIGVEMSQSKCNIMLEVLQVGSKILNQVVVIGFFRYFHDKKVVQLNCFVDNQQISWLPIVSSIKSLLHVCWLPKMSQIQCGNHKSVEYSMILHPFSDKDHVEVHRLLSHRPCTYRCPILRTARTKSTRTQWFQSFPIMYLYIIYIWKIWQGLWLNIIIIIAMSGVSLPPKVAR